MAGYDFGELATPVAAPPAAKKYDFGDMAAPVAATPDAPAKSEGPSALSKAAGFGFGNFNLGVADLAGMPVDAVLNVWDLGKAAIGTGYQALTGKSAPMALEPSDRSQYLGTAESNENIMRKLGMVNGSVEATTPAGRITAAALRASPSALFGKPATSARALVGDIAGATASGATAQGAKEAGAGTEGQILAGMLPGVAHAGVHAGVDAARKAVVGDTDIPARTKELAAGGVENPTAGLVTGNRTLQGAEGISAATLGGKNTFEEAAAKRTQGIQGKVGDVVEKMSPGGTSPTGAGNAVTRGLEKFKERFGNKQEKLEARADSFVKPDDPFKVTNTRKMLDEATKTKPGEEALTTATGSARLREWKSMLDQDLSHTIPNSKGGAALAKDTITYGTLRKVRTQVGAAIGNPSLFPDVSKADLKGLYGALTRDLEEGFSAKGGAAKKAWDQAQTHYRVGSDRQRDVLERISDKGSPEEIFAAARQGSKEGATRLTRLLNSLPVKDRGTVSAAFVDRLGRVNAESPFSLDRFVTDWDNLHSDTKKAILKGSAASDMETIVKAARDVKAAGNLYANPSGTAKLGLPATEVVSTVTGALTAAMTGHPGAGAALALGAGVHAAANNYFAKAMHDPAFLKWLADGTKAPVADQAKYAARLYEIAKHSNDPEIQDAEAGLAISLGAGQ
jgi:hypothetical protein